MTGYVARALLTNRWAIGEAIARGNATAQTLLGINGRTDSAAVLEHLDQHPARAAHITAAVVLGGIEGNTSRYPKTETAAYLQALAAWGYTLSPVERIAAMLTDEDATAQ